MTVTKVSDKPQAPARTRRATTQWNLVFHYVAIILTILSGVVLVPLYLRFIPTRLYGFWLATGNILAWLSVLDPGFSTVLQQQMAAAFGAQDKESVSALVSAGLLLGFVMGCCVLLGGIGIRGQLGNWLYIADASDRYIINAAFDVGIIGTMLSITSFALGGINLGLQASIGCGLIYLVTNLVSMMLTILLLFGGKGLVAIAAGLFFRGAGLLIGNGLYLIWRLKREKIPFRWTWKRLPQLVTLSSYSFLGRVAAVLSRQIDSLVVARHLGPKDVAVLNFSRRAPQLSQLFVERPALAFVPSIAHLCGEGDFEKARAILLRLASILIWVVGLTIGGFVLFNRDFVALWVGINFFGGTSVNLIVCSWLLVRVITNVLSSLCYALGDIRGNSLALTGESLVFIPCLFVGLRWFGLSGVVAAPLIAIVLVSLWYYPRSFSRLLRLNRHVLVGLAREISQVLLISSGLCLVFRSVNSTGWMRFLIATSTFTAAYTLILVTISQKARREAASFCAMVAKRLRSRRPKARRER